MDSTIDPETNGGSSSELCAKTASVEVDGAQPKVGDEIEVTVKGKVTRTDNEDTYFTPTEVNGEPVQSSSADSGNDDAGMADLEKAYQGSGV